jgi:1-acyl-sn-glycerol-3-phosphate acyltransferase
MTAPQPPRPSYRIPIGGLALFAFDLLLGRRRSFARDAATVMEHNRRLPRRIEGLTNVPEEGPFVLVMNHFSRRGLRPYHCAMAVTAAIATRRSPDPEVRWAFKSEYIGVRLGPLVVPRWFLRWLFRRIARTYRFTIIARRPERAMERAAALRELSRALERQPVALTPEGLESRGQLIEPAPGTGLFLSSLCRRGAPLLPVGLWEDEDGVFHIRFGRLFRLELPPGVSRDEEDRLARTQVMLAIGRLLPPEWRGVYREALAGEQG